MKKLIVSFLVTILVAVNVEFAHAAVVRIAEVDAPTFIKAMNAAIYTEEFQKETPLIMTEPIKVKNEEMPEIGTTAYGCNFGLKTDSAHSGDILFFVDGEDKVSALKIVAYSDAAGAAAMNLLMTAAKIAGLTDADVEFLIVNLDGGNGMASSVVWSDSRNRCYVLITTDRPKPAEGFQLLLIADDKKN